ncbi:MAG: hypothetical protein K0S33_4066 [Bacteroidetes bacterium]|jgi:hypothetical protein|nr:hypothetical protein [Bacteroidota bacterium]
MKDLLLYLFRALIRGSAPWKITTGRTNYGLFFETLRPAYVIGTNGYVLKKNTTNNSF